MVGLERAYFCKQFRKSAGLSFSVWSRQIRIEQAKYLLSGSDTPIKLVAAAVGYGDVTTFERNFRKCVDLSPRAFRHSRRISSAIGTPNADKSTQNADN